MGLLTFSSQFSFFAFFSYLFIVDAKTSVRPFSQPHLFNTMEISKETRDGNSVKQNRAALCVLCRDKLSQVNYVNRIK